MLQKTPKKSSVPADEYIAQLFESVGNNIWVSIERLPNLMDGVNRGVANFFATKSGTEIALFFGFFAVAFIAAYFAGTASDRFVFSAWRKQVELAKPDTLSETLKALGLRFSLDMASLVVFSITIYVVLRLLMPVQDDLNAAWWAVWYLWIIVLVAAAISRFLGAPKRPDLRLLTASDETIQFFHRHFLIIVFIAGVLDFFLRFLLANGIELGELRLGFWINLLLYGWVLQMIWRGRQGIFDILMGGEESPSGVQIRFAKAWPFVAMALVVGNWLLIEFIVAAGRFDLLVGQENVTLGFILFVPALDTAIRGLVRHIAPPLAGEGALAELAHKRTKESYVRIGRVLLSAAGIFIIASMWGIDLDNLAADGLGAKIASGLIEVILFFALGYMLWEIATLWVTASLPVNRRPPGST